MIEYNSFMGDLESHNLEHWAKVIRQSGCKVMIELLDTNIGIDIEYNKWCKENCNDKYFVYNENYIFFETEEDATAFKLRWL